MVEHSPHRDAFDRELKRLDARLFLELRLLETGQPVWAVTEHVGERAGGPSPYRTVCYWTDEQTGEPLPLTWRLLDKVKALEGGWARVMPALLAAEERVTAEANREIREHVQAMADDMEPRMRETRSAVLHRSVGLRMARDRRRARGEKC